MANLSRVAFLGCVLATLGCKTTDGQSNVKTFVSTVKPSVQNPPVSLPNTHKVDDRVYRGMLPIDPKNANSPFAPLTTDVLAQYDADGHLITGTTLQATDVLILDSRFNVDVISEMAALTSLGVVSAENYAATDDAPAYAAQEQTFRSGKPWEQIVTAGKQNYFYRYLNWADVMTNNQFAKNCKQYVDALRILQHVRQSPDRTVFFHCTVGEDRTGVVAALYDFLSDPSKTLPQVFHDEMCERGYEAGDYQKPWFVVNKIRDQLTPFFLRMAYKVRKSNPDLTWDNLNYATCDTDPGIADTAFRTDEYNAAQYKCETASSSPPPAGFVRPN